MIAVSIDITTLLAANALGTYGTDLFAMEWNDELDAQTLILDQAGIDSPLKESHEQPFFQVLVRGEKGDDMNTAYQAIRAIHEFLIQAPTQLIGLCEYTGFDPLSTIINLGRDDNNRAIFSMNYYTFRSSL